MITQSLKKNENYFLVCGDNENIYLLEKKLHHVENMMGKGVKGSNVYVNNVRFISYHIRKNGLKSNVYTEFLIQS